MRDISAEQTVVSRIDPDTQTELVKQIREVKSASPFLRPRTPNGLDMRVQVTSAGELGWVGDGEYRYTRTDAAGKPWPRIPELWKQIADDVAGEHPWDSAIVNYYAPDAALGWHRDQAEANTTLPIVTISIGDACSWAVRADETSKPSRTRLETGDVTLLAGPSRSYLHTVERIIAAPLFSPLPLRGRISITLRVAGRPS